MEVAKVVANTSVQRKKIALRFSPSGAAASVSSVRFDEIAGPERAAHLRRLFLGAINDAYTENVGRFSEDLGDNTLTFAVCVVHNLRHMLEEALEHEPGIRITRPRNSFQVEIDARRLVHFYKGRSGASDVGEIRFDQSRTKLELVSANAEQLAMVFDEDEAVLEQCEVRHLVVVHVGNPRDGFVDAWIGAPVLSPINGFRWLWLERLDGTGEAAVPSPAPPALPPVWLDDSSLPEVIVELRLPGDDADAANVAP